MDNFISDIDDTSYVYVTPDPSRGPGGFEYCLTEDLEEELREPTRESLQDKWEEQVKEMYEKVFILKESHQFVTRIQ